MARFEVTVKLERKDGTRLKAQRVIETDDGDIEAAIDYACKTAPTGGYAGYEVVGFWAVDNAGS